MNTVDYLLIDSSKKKINVTYLRAMWRNDNDGAHK